MLVLNNYVPIRKLSSRLKGYQNIKMVYNFHD